MCSAPPPPDPHSSGPTSDRRDERSFGGTGVRDILFAWDDGRAAAAAPSDESAAPSDMCSLGLFQAIFTLGQGAYVSNYRVGLNLG